MTLVDIELGGEDGLEITRQLSDTSAPNSKVILVSTHSEDDLAHLIAASPALGFVPKTRLSAQAIRELMDTPLPAPPSPP